MVELLTVTEAARKMHVSRQAIYGWINSGKIRPVKAAGGTLRIPEDQLIAPIPQRKEAARLDKFRIRDVSHVEQDSTEPLGTKEKFWYWGDDSTQWLFKVGRPATGDNWAEKVACELCNLLGVPHATYELAVWKDKRGVITSSFIPGDKEYRLVHGNELLAELEPSYETTRRYKYAKHTLALVLGVVGRDDVEPPIGFRSFGEIHSAIDVFVGYLMLDAWIANQDRHHENWAILEAINKRKYLAPSYDHAACLGRNETDYNRQKRLVTRDAGYSMSQYVERARSAFYASDGDTKPMSTIDAFREASRGCLGATHSWIQRLKEISPSDTVAILKRLPEDEISEVGIEFAQMILDLNRQRILSLEL